MRRLFLIAVGFVLAAAILVPVGPAGAAAGIPTLTGPANAAAVTVNPVFTWNAATSAVRYVLEVSPNADLSSPSVTIPTRNLAVTPQAELPIGTNYWRVGAYDVATGGTPTYSVIRSFTKTMPAPTILSPAASSVITHPAAPTFTWNPVPGANQYLLRVTTGWSDPIYEFTNKTSFTPTTILPFSTALTWTLQAGNSAGQWSAPSAGVTFTVAPPVAPTQVSPGVPPGSGLPIPVIEQLEFVWNPLPGAVAYEIEYGWSNGWVMVEGTRYSPPTTPNNSGGAWRIRAVTADNQRGATSDYLYYSRAWPGETPSGTDFARPTPVSPANNSYNLRELNFTWTPARLANRYLLEFASDANFSSIIYTATTTHTTWAPTASSWEPEPGLLYYWRVRGLDDPTPVNSQYVYPAPNFAYYPEVPAQTAPSNGSISYAPRLEWNPASSTNVANWEVKILNSAGALVKTARTFNSSYTPTGLSTDPAQSPYSWTVRAVDDRGRVLQGEFYPAPPLRTFTLVAPTNPQLSPTPNPTSPANPSGTRVAPLSWQPVTTNGTYTVRYRSTGSSTWSNLASGLTTPGYSHGTDSVNPGTYDWSVQAFNSGGTLVSEGSVAQFTVTSLPASAAVSPVHCPPSSPGCSMLNDTPTLDWAAVPGATGYQLKIATNVNFTSPIVSVRTGHTTYTPQTSFTNGSYYWYAQPCFGTRCGAPAESFAGSPTTPVRAFQKTTKPVPLLTPTAGSTQSGTHVTFTWTGFLQSNQSGPVADRVTQEAKSYRVEVSQSSSFSSFVEQSPDLDSMTYTSTVTYPNTTLYWRVLVRDGSNNWYTPPASSTLSFIKTTPTPTLTAPAAGATVTSTPTLTWPSAVFAWSYEVEVYKNLAASFDNANRVFVGTTANTAIMPSASLSAALAPGTYGWRVRVINGDNVAGPWSALTNTTVRQFTVAGTVPTLTAPANAATGVNLSTLRFQWASIPAATKYRIEVGTTSTFGTIVETVDTVMPTWAVTAPYTAGTKYWRVKTLDASGTVMATSATRSFTG